MKTVSNTAKNSGMWIRHWPAASTHPYFRTLNNDFFIWACHILFTVISKFYGDFELLALLYRSRKFQMGIWLTNIFFRLRDWFTGRYYRFLINISVSIVLYSSLSLASWKIFCISLKFHCGYIHECLHAQSSFLNIYIYICIHTWIHVRSP